MMAGKDKGIMKHLFNYYVRLKKQRVCQHRSEANRSLPQRLLLPLIGLLALIWFLVRVIPKPNRATYPCQRIAFPLASGFVIWLMGILYRFILFVAAEIFTHIINESSAPAV